MNAKSFHFILAAFLIIVVAGCGGGGGGNSDGGNDNPIPGTGTVSGIVGTTYTADISKLSLKTQPFASVGVARSRIRRSSVANEKIIKFRSGMSEGEVQQLLSNLGGILKHKIYGPDNVYVVQIDPQTFQQSSLKANSDILYVEDNLILHAADLSVTPNDSEYTTYQTWNYSLLNLSRAWSIQKGNPRVVVAVLDTGISTSHPDLASNLVSGYDFVDWDAVPSDNQYYDNDNRYSHGTHVAGIVSAVTNNAQGMAGVGWNVKIMPVRVLAADGNGTTAMITNGIYWAVDHGANIINMSLTGQFPVGSAPQTFKTALQYAIDRNVTIVAAAGNEKSFVGFPANYPGVIAVSATDYQGNIAPYSNYGPEIWVCAPGGSGNSETITSYVFSTTYDKQTQQNTYIWMAGTSMASPHVAGIVALLYSHGITNPSVVRQTLKAAGNGSFNNQLGYGLPDAYAAVNGSPSGAAATKVFYYLPESSTCSSMSNAASNGSYSISNIPAGSVIMCAFIDFNLDGQVGTGDMFAHVGVTVTSGKTLNQNMTLQSVVLSTPKRLTDYIKDGFQ
ncbi:serine protease [Hydrogenispora ethanolica]|uniref:Serine protease n=1 Tax=Hydrogenispora ethanolica TaxID=1082276 RepID=A0A4V2QGC5_HYDET|nr:S8 family serine peptidase [Hydrogenispora ethanolica]TCL75287.1 serine protease [Hydrogenispora ethanolica]